MKVKFNRAALSEALGLLTTVVPARTTKPILQGLKIQAEKEKVCISATDFEIGITCLIPQAEVETKGLAVVPAERLAAIVRESTDDVLAMEVAEATCRIKGNDSNFTIYGHQPEQYPEVPGFDGGAQLEADLIKLQEAVKHCLFATAKENTRYALSGILWEPSGKKLTLVGTDGRRLAKYKLTLNSEVDKKIEAEKFIVPAKTMTLLDKVGAGEKDKVAVRFADGKAIFTCGKVVISSNLVEGTFPKYEDIIPADYKNKVQLNTAAILSAVKRAALLTNEDSKGVKLALSKKSIIFTSRAPEMGDAEIAMEIDYKGEPIEIGFNPQFLVDVLRVIREDSFELQLGQSDRPGLIKASELCVYRYAGKSFLKKAVSMDGEFILEQANRRVVRHRRPANLTLGQDMHRCLGKLVKSTKKNTHILDLFEQIAGNEMTAHCQPDSIIAGVLKVKVKPGPYMYHLRNRTDEILKQIQTACPSANIREIRLLCSR